MTRLRKVFGRVIPVSLIVASLWGMMAMATNQVADSAAFASPHFDIDSLRQGDNKLLTVMWPYVSGYVLFYVLHCFFLPFFFLLLSNVRKWIISTYLRENTSSASYLKLFVFVALVASILNCLENFCYIYFLLRESSLGIFGGLAMLKDVAVAFAILGWVLYLLPRRWSFYKHGLQFVLSSAVSLLLLVLVGFGLTILDQGATLVVHLYEDHSIAGLVSIVATVFCVNMLAILISHFPEYFDIAIKKREGVKWHMHQILGPFGVVTYRIPQKATSNPRFVSKRVQSVTRFLRYTLGLLTYVAWFYVVYKAFDLYGLTHLSAGPSVTVFSALVLLLYTKYFIRFEYHKTRVKEDPKGETHADSYSYLKQFEAAYYWMVTVTVILGLLVLLVIYFFGWHHYSFRATIFFMLANAVTFLMFRTVRSSLYLLHGDGFKNWKKQADRDALSSEIDENGSLEGEGLSDLKVNVFKKVLLRFSSDYYFLRYIRMGGILTLLFLIAMNLGLPMGYVVDFSSIPTFLAFLVNIYALIVLILKHFLYHGSSGATWSVANVWPSLKCYRTDENQKNNDKDSSPLCWHTNGASNEGSTDQVPAKRASKFSCWEGAILLAVFAVAVSIVMDRSGNIHRLNFVKVNDAVTTDQYSALLEREILTHNHKRMIQVASFGGGLKSNLWNLLLLDKLDLMYTAEHDAQGPYASNFLDRCVSLSGVSGGALGLGNYMFLDHAHRMSEVQSEDRSSRRKLIEEIGRQNILAIDVAGVLIHDSFLDRFLFDDSDVNKDRAYYAMKQYHQMIADTFEIDAPLRQSLLDVYYKMSDSGTTYHPALIINTASTGPKPGVSLSLRPDEEGLFPGYIEFSKVGSSAMLSYYDAMSTSNRFPIMSPAAQVEELGFFLDGGYFENSGLMTSQFFLDYLRGTCGDDHPIDTVDVAAVSILNGKSEYVRWFIKEHKIQIEKLNHSTNVSSIIKGLVDIVKLPNVLMEKQFADRDDDERLSIYLPHPITTEDIEEQLKGSVLWDGDLIASINENNQKIDLALEQYYERQCQLACEASCPDGCEMECTQKCMDSGKAYISDHGIVVPPLARTLSGPAVDYEAAMVDHHEAVNQQLEAIIQFLR